MPPPLSDDQVQEDERRNSYRPWYLPFHPKTSSANSPTEERVFLQRPWWGPLLFDNESSDARDHCANERTFLSYLRLSVYMSIVSIAIILSFHLKSQPTALELRMALPLGIVFWCLGLLCLGLGFGNYIKTVTKFSRRSAIVQTGWRTQVVFTLVSVSIVVVCILFLATNANRK